MKLFVRSTRDSQILYTTCDGMGESTITNLMADIGHTDIEFITEEEYIANLPTII